MKCCGCGKDIPIDELCQHVRNSELALKARREAAIGLSKFYTDDKESFNEILKPVIGE